ncbi:MAG: hypothetical protein KDJ22_15670 [Candidatus Competibacteraceae bacterium]|nr:hypothetical protein [Candidatus Competibacteraceae bacterium]
MYELIKHAPNKSSTILLETTCESMALMRFEKSAALLKQHESLELKHDGEVIEYQQAPHYGPIDSDDASVGSMP